VAQVGALMYIAPHPHGITANDGELFSWIAFTANHKQATFALAAIVIFVHALILNSPSEIL
jgi:hypothetical protein